MDRRSAPAARLGVRSRGDRIVRVGDDAELLSLASEGTELLDLAGRMVCPGFNDAHTHFENAVDWHFQVALTDVNDQARLEERVAATAGRLTPGVWITGETSATSPPPARTRSRCSSRTLPPSMR